MQCERFEARLQDLLDQRQRPECDTQLLEHAEACENCRETLLVQEQLFAGLDLWEAPSLSEAFAARVVKQYLSDERSGASLASAHDSADTSTAFPMWKLFAGALAASLLIGAVTVASRLNRPEVPVSPPNVVPAVVHQEPLENPPAAPAVTPAPKAELAVTPPVEPSPEPQVTPPTESVLSADHLAVQWVENAPELLDGRHTGRMIREVTSSLPEVPVDDSIPGLRPITSSVSYTFGMFRRTLPGGRDLTPREPPKSPPPGKPQADISRDDGQTQTA